MLISGLLFPVSANGSIVSLRARSMRNPAESSNCHLRYIGMTDSKVDRDRKTMVRTYIDCLTSANLNEYLQTIGFTYQPLS